MTTGNGVDGSEAISAEAQLAQSMLALVRSYQMAEIVSVRAVKAKVGRPKVAISGEQLERAVLMRREGHSWSEVSRAVHVSAGTIRRVIKQVA